MKTKKNFFFFLNVAVMFQDNGREALDLTASPLRPQPATNTRNNHPPPMVIQGDFRKVIICHNLQNKNNSPERNNNKKKN